MENLKPAAGTVTETERTYAIDFLTTSQHNLHQSLSSLSNEQATFKSDTNRWSILDCAEHIFLVEKGIFRAVREAMNVPANPEMRNQIRVTDIDVIKSVRSRTMAISSPAPFVPTGRFTDIATALQAFDEQRTAAIDFVQTAQDDLRTHYFEHFILGTLDVYQAILLMSSHVERHRKQIDEVKASDGFPK